MRLKALYAPTPQLTIKGLIEVHRNEAGASNIVNQQPFEDGTFLQAVFRNGKTGSYDDYDLYNLTVAYDLGFAELLSSTSYNRADSDQSFTQLIGTEPVPLLEVLISDWFLDSSIASQELRLTSTTRGRFNWTAGAVYKDAEVSYNFGQGIDANFNSGADQYRSAFLAAATNKLREWAGFGDVSYRLTDRFSLGGGLRYFRGDQEQIVTVPSRYTLSQTPDKATYRAYGKFAARENVNLYFSVGTGFRSGGFNNPSEVPRGAPANYGTENSIFYELGMKTLLAGGRVRFDAAAYYGEWNDMQVDIATTSPVDGGYLQYTANGQDAEIKGVEVEISLAATDGLTLNLAGDVTHTEISRVDPKNNAPGFFLGDKIDYVPKYKVSAGADYRFNWSPSMPGFFLVNVDRIGKSYVTARTFTFGNTVDVAPELAFLSARIGGERAGWKWALFGANLTDERKPLSGATTGLRPQARPRTLGVMLGKSF